MAMLWFSIVYFIIYSLLNSTQCEYTKTNELNDIERVIIYTKNNNYELRPNVEHIVDNVECIKDNNNAIEDRLCNIEKFIERLKTL